VNGVLVRRIVVVAHELELSLVPVVLSRGRQTIVQDKHSLWQSKLAIPLVVALSIQVIMQIDCIQGSLILESSLSRTFQGQTPQPSTCSSACIASMRGNGVCDQECYNLNCNYDDGDCLAQLLPGSMLCCNFAEMYLRIIFSDAVCPLITSCSLCTITPGCGWCGTTGQCVSGSFSGPTSSTCSNWKV
jgi:hypothetical protein